MRSELSKHSPAPQGAVAQPSGERNGIPFFAKKGWTRPKENAAKHPLKGADGVVASSYRLYIPNDFDNRWLETTTPSALNMERCRFSLGAATPPSRRRGLRFPPCAFGNSPLPSGPSGVLPLRTTICATFTKMESASWRSVPCHHWRSPSTQRRCASH
jgi:hypothetical protein